MDVSQTQALPTLLYLLCAMSSMAFLVSSYTWLWKVSQTPDQIDKEFKPSIHAGQLYAFFSVMVLSIFIGMYDHFLNNRDVHIGGELFILIAAVIYVYIKTDSKNKIAHISRTAFKALSFGLFCVFGWCITIIIGVVLTHLFNAVGLSGGSLDPNVVFLTGLLWNVPVVILYAKIVKNSGESNTYKASGFHKFLWPVLMAYTVLLVPLLIQQIAVSEEWQQMKHEKPIRSV